MLIKFFLIMTITASLYLQFANAQGRDLNTKDGIIIYSTDSEEIPMYIMFIPANLEKNESFNDLLSRTLSKKETLTYIVFFQAIRWTQPDIGTIMSSINFENGNYGTLHKSVKVSYGRITFDKTYPGDPEIEEDTTITQTKLYYKDFEFSINVTEWPRLMGVPKVFERTDLY
ncbi:MAG: hypothetical protein H7289_16260 [Mucilaginibacter sp.]|nr:hypothetical protein [Mucilaginibacter sp.]